MSTTCEVTVTHKTKQDAFMSTMPIYSTMNKKSSKKKRCMHHKSIWSGQ